MALEGWWNFGEFLAEFGVDRTRRLDNGTWIRLESRLVEQAPMFDGLLPRLVKLGVLACGQPEGAIVSQYQVRDAPRWEATAEAIRAALAEMSLSSVQRPCVRARCRHPETGHEPDGPCLFCRCDRYYSEDGE